MACHGSDNTVELFLVCSDEEVKKRLQKKAKKKRKNKQGVAETTEEIATDEPATLQVWPVAIVIDFFTFRSLNPRDASLFCGLGSSGAGEVRGCKRATPSASQKALFGTDKI